MSGGRPVVLTSIESEDGVHCLDVRREPESGFSAALCRRDAEDPHGWRILTVAALPGAGTERAAIAVAFDLFGWPKP